MTHEAGEPVAPLPGQMAFRFMVEPCAVVERFKLVSGQAQRKDSSDEARGGRLKRERLPKAG